MALRVLLADESPAIRKVIQLALKDFGVEVRAVPVGLDVEEVAKTFQPDIVFADVLLQKKSGYDVSRDLKKDPHLKDIPVILMWSGFMELDKARLQESNSDAQLEKPFDAEALRNLVFQFVPKARANPVALHVDLPDLPPMEAPKPLTETLPPSETELRPAPLAPITPASQQPAEPHVETVEEEAQELHLAEDHTDRGSTHERNWNMDSFEPLPELDLGDDEEFKQVPLRAVEDSDADQPKRGEEWVQEPVHQFQVKVPENPDDVEIEVPDEETQTSTSFMPPQKTPAPGVAELTPQLTEDQLERIIRAQSKEIIEKVVWKLVPEIATDLIKEEIRRLTEEPRL